MRASAYAPASRSIPGHTAHVSRGRGDGVRPRRPRGHPRGAARARLRAGHQAPHRPLGGLHPGGRRGAEAPGAGGEQGPGRRGAVRVHQRQRPPAPDHRRGPVGQRRRHHPDAVELAAPLRQRPRRRLATSPSRSARRRAGTTTSSTSTAKVGGTLARRAPRHAAATPSRTGAPGSTRSAPRSSRRPGTSTARSARSSRPRASRSGRRSATASATRRPSPIPLLWDFGGAEVDQSGKKVVINSKGTLESVKFMQAFWKDACDEGGVGLGRHQQQPRLPRRRVSATLNGASIYIVAKRQKDKIKDDKGEPLFQDIEHAGAHAQGPGRTVRSLRRVPALDHEVLEEPEARQGLPEVAASGRELRQVVRGQRGVQRRRHQEVGRPSDVGQGRQAAAGLPAGGASDAHARVSRARPRPRRPSRTRSTSSSTCTPRPCRAPRPRTPSSGPRPS